MTEETEGLVAEYAEPIETYEMPKEEYEQKMRDVHLGISETLPGGTSVKEIRDANLKLEKEQDAARAGLVKKTMKTVLAGTVAEETNKIQVTTSINGVSSEDPVMTEVVEPPVEPVNDLPKDLPHRDDVLKNGYTDWEKFAQLDEDQILAMSGVGKGKAKEIAAFIATARS